MKKRMLLPLVLLMTLLAADALAVHQACKDYFPDYRLSQLMIYEGSKPVVSDEAFWDMARSRNVYGWNENRLISVMQLLEYAHDGNTNHQTYMRGLFLGRLYIHDEAFETHSGRSFHRYEIRGDGMSIQPLTVVFEVMGDEEVLVECERPYKQEVAPVDHIDRHYGIKLFDYGHRVLDDALDAIERGDARTARSLVYGLNEYDSGSYPKWPGYPEQKVTITFYKGGLPVYAGPGKNYARLGNGKATMGSDDWCYWYGNVGDWALVEYELSKGGTRTGWVKLEEGRAWQANTEAAYFKAGLEKVK